MKRPPADDESPKVLDGPDWESLNVTSSTLGDGNEVEEVTALAASDRHVAAQQQVDADILVFSVETGQLEFKLTGHGFGGHCLRMAGDILYSGSMDKTVR